ncbi:hypothetical protein ACYOEI_26970 [Singulisphaera rosea]
MQRFESTGALANGLPRPGFASALGFWFTTAHPLSPEPVVAFAIDFAPTQESFKNRSTPVLETLLPQRPEQTVRLKSPSPEVGELLLKVSAAGALISASDSAWAAQGEAVLLALGVYWRFLAIDRELDRLTEQARDDLRHAVMPGLRTLQVRRQLVDNAAAIRRLHLNLPHYAGPLTDSLSFSSTVGSAQTFEVLAEKLRLDAWCERIDERAEAVEASYESMVDRLLGFQSLVGEVLIIIILLGELGLTIWGLLG